MYLFQGSYRYSQSYHAPIVLRFAFSFVWLLDCSFTPIQGFDSCALRALQGGAPAGGSTGVAGAHKFIEGYYFLVPFRRVSRLRRPFVLRPPRRRAGRADQPPSARAASQE